MTILGELACRPTQKNTGQAGMLNPLARNGLPCIGPQPARAKGGARRASPLARLQNYMLLFF